MSQAYMKATLDGLNGSGKSGTAARLAMGISIEYCNRAPVIVFDSEERWRFLKVTMFDPERVPLLVVPGKSLLVLRTALSRVEAERGAVFVGDQLTTPWMEGLKTFAYDDGTLPFSRRQQLMNEWEPVVESFRYGKFHAICCGRLGYNWTNIEDENGHLQLTQGDSKFNAGGGNNFGYEADLELEMRRKKRNMLGRLRGKTSVEHVCDVVKDAAGGILNGKQFVFPSTEGQYKLGAYKTVLDVFRPYVDFMLQVDAPEQNKKTSRELIVSGKTEWSKDQTERKSALEEYSAYLEMCFPGGEGRSKVDTMFRNMVTEMLTGSVSRSRMEEELATGKIQGARDIVQALWKRIQDGERPTDQASLIQLVTLCVDDLAGKRPVTLMEAMGKASLVSNGVRHAQEARRSAQPAVTLAEMERRDEVAGD